MQQKIKSYVLRAGRMSPRQQEGYEQHLPDFCLPPPGERWDLVQAFSRSAPLIVEIGFGMGASLLAMAEAHPQINYIGIEVHRAGLGRLAADLHDHQINNVRIAPYDAVEVLNTCVEAGSLSGVQIFFPDPWPKKRHHKRRLIQTEFISHVLTRLKPGGFIHCATDWEAYAQHMLSVLSSIPGLENDSETHDYVPRPTIRPLTKFEQRGQNLGHGVWDLMFKRTVDLAQTIQTP